MINLILWALYTGMQWKCLPVRTDHDGTPAIHYTTVKIVSGSSGMVQSCWNCRTTWVRVAGIDNLLYLG